MLDVILSIHIVGSTPSAFGGFAQNQSSGAFGSQNQQNQPQQPNTFGAFGSQNQQNQPQQSNVFGPFGSQNQQNQQQQPSTSAPGASSSIFGTQSNPSPASGNDGNLSPSSSIEAQVRSVYEAWNPQSPQCRFQVSTPRNLANLG
jgi:nuclear pore complex protein Nup54